MLYLSLLLSAALLVAANRLVARSKYPVPWVILTGIGFVIGPVFLLMSAFPAVAWQALFLSGLLVVLVARQRGRRLYPPLSIVATVVAYGILVTSAIEKRSVAVAFRKQYPLESLDDRLPPRPSTGTAQPSASSPHLAQLETEISLKSPAWGYTPRERALESVHASAVEGFVNAAGFGVGRMTADMADPRVLREELPERPLVPQPDYLHPFVAPTEGLTTDVPGWLPEPMTSMHVAGVIDFVNPRGFGFVKDRQVAGFQRHAMTKVPQSPTVWKVARLELVGLVVHDKPVVYATANLPRMDDLRAIPTRDPDRFEADALEALRGGEEVYVRGTGDAARMVGAIRATKQCVACHGGTRGDLLGAFSYGLRAEKP